jgi:hypothetical protein
MLKKGDKGKLISLPDCALPAYQDAQCTRYFGVANTLTLGKVYEVLDLNGSNVIVLDDDGVQAMFYSGRLESVEQPVAA